MGLFGAYFLAGFLKAACILQCLGCILAGGKIIKMHISEIGHIASGRSEPAEQ